MSTAATLRAADGMTLPGLAAAMKANLDDAMAGCMKAGAREALHIINHEGHKHYIRNRKRKPIYLSGKLGPSSSKAAIVYGIPAGFWSIVEQGTHPKKERIVPRKKGKKGKPALLRTPYGPRPYVLSKAVGPQGHPWMLAMHRVNSIPNHIFEPSITNAFKGIFK